MPQISSQKIWSFVEFDIKFLGESNNIAEVSAILSLMLVHVNTRLDSEINCE